MTSIQQSNNSATQGGVGESSGPTPPPRGGASAPVAKPKPLPRPPTLAKIPPQVAPRQDHNGNMGEKSVTRERMLTKEPSYVGSDPCLRKVINPPTVQPRKDISSKPLPATPPKPAARKAPSPPAERPVANEGPTCPPPPKPMPRKGLNPSQEDVLVAAAVNKPLPAPPCPAVKQKLTPSRPAPPPPAHGGKFCPPPLPSKESKPRLLSKENESLLMSASEPCLPLVKSESKEMLKRDQSRKPSYPGTSSHSAHHAPSGPPPAPFNRSMSRPAQLTAKKKSPYQVKRLPETKMIRVVKENHTINEGEGSSYERVPEAKRKPNERRSKKKPPPRPSPPKPQRSCPNKPSARALFDCFPSASDELPFLKGDILILLRRVDDGWMECELNYKRGLVPINYIEILIDLPQRSPERHIPPVEISSRMPDPEPQVFSNTRMPDPEPEAVSSGRMPDPVSEDVADHGEDSKTEQACDEDGTRDRAEALFDNLEDLEFGDLSFRAGDVIIITDVIDEQWMRGKCDGFEGIFPSNLVRKIGAIEKIYVATGNDLATRDNELRFSRGDEIVLEEEVDENWFLGSLVINRGHRGLVPFSFAQFVKERPAGALPMTRSISSLFEGGLQTCLSNSSLPSVGGGESNTGPKLSRSVSSLHSLAGEEVNNSDNFSYVKADFDYVGELNVELSFVEGDVIRVIEPVNDEWSKGELKGVQGIFPTNFTSKTSGADYEDFGPSAEMGSQQLDNDGDLNNEHSKEELFPPTPFENVMQCRDYEAVDMFMDQMPKRLDHDVVEISKYVKGKFREERLICRALFRFMCMNIDYCWEWKTGGPLRPADFNTAVGTLREKKSVCQGYAELFRSLCSESGVLCEIVCGRGRGHDTFEPHAWNRVLIDDEWKLVDCCWGAGFVENGQYTRRFEPSYFLTPPSQFIWDHLPDDMENALLGSFQCSIDDLMTYPKIFSGSGCGFQMSVTKQMNETTTESFTFRCYLDSSIYSLANGLLVQATNAKDGNDQVQCLTDVKSIDELTNVFRTKIAFNKPGEYVVRIMTPAIKETGHSYSLAAEFLVSCKAQQGSLGGKRFPHVYPNSPIQFLSFPESADERTTTPLKFIYYGEDVRSMFADASAGGFAEIPMESCGNGTYLCEVDIEFSSKVNDELRVFGRRGEGNGGDGILSLSFR
eukprot:Nk52_evm36s236 gene=Nk52_evmTU36s236